MVVKPRGRNVSTPLMYLNGVALEYVDSVKYLGVTLSNDMKDDADMNRHLLYNAAFVYFYQYGLWPEIKSYYYIIILSSSQ